MSTNNYMTTYNIFETCNLSMNNTMQEFCDTVAQWVNDTWGDILIAKSVVITENKYARVEIYQKDNEGVGIYFGTSTNNCTYAGFIKNGAYSVGTTSISVLQYTANSTSVTPAKLSDLGTTDIVNLCLRVIQGDYGIAVDFVDTVKNADKKVDFVVCNDKKLSLLLQPSGAFYCSINGAYIDCGALQQLSYCDVKLLTKIALPKTNVIPEHLYVSDMWMGSNIPYELNGKNYVDLFCTTTYKGFAMEL
jgi:hypothetical protein